MQQNVVRVEISVDDRLRQQVEVAQALRHVQRDPQLGQDVHGAALLVKKTEKLKRLQHLRHSRSSILSSGTFTYHLLKILVEIVKNKKYFDQFSELNAKCTSLFQSLR